MNGISDEAKVNVVAMFLKGTMNLWWRNQEEDLAVERDVPRINNLTEMKEALRAQFRPGSQSWLARNQLMAFMHSSWVQDYIKMFLRLMLEIKYMLEEYQIYHFLKGLKPWAQSELHHRNVQYLVVIDKLPDYNVGSSKCQEGDDCHTERNNKRRQRNKAKASENQGEPKDKKFDVPKEKNMRKFVSCFVCGGNHYGKEFPLKHETMEEGGKLVQLSVGVLGVLSDVAAEMTES